ncbi:MAG: hypothetical protein LBU89_01220 [Fibromonadaceae bacterium]|jgi:hypothetical protein|nr:hypothetical protein [Fibromonadaceae bacterium]
MRYAIVLCLLFGLSFAQETDVLDRQKAVLSALDSIEENTIGFSLNGRAKGGFLGSVLDGQALSDGENASEYSTFTNMLLSISVRPSNETKATFDLRFHKDWQSAYREGNNSPAIQWWSYDGNILDKKLKFNLGTMRLAYTPLTIYLPEPDLIMEPEIFASLKKEAMEERYLDGTNRRLLQGLNAEYRTSIGILENILLQGTFVRLHRNDAFDRVATDFNYDKDRFSAAARFEIETFGFSFGVSDVYTFDRFKSAMRTLEDLFFEKNNVLSFNLGYDAKKLLSGPVNFGVGAEFALSDWKHYRESASQVEHKQLRVDGFDKLIPSNSVPGTDSISRYPYYTTTTKTEYNKSKVDSYENQSALLANAFVSFNQNLLEAKLSGHFLKTDPGFESELAASPAYLPKMPILNSNTALDPAFGLLETFRSGSLENMYFSLYNSLPLNALTMVTDRTDGAGNVFPGGSNNEREIHRSTKLYNNYKFAQYQRNAYTQQTYSRFMRNSTMSDLDPGVNLALPFGYATPDREGGDANLSVVWNNAVNVNGVFGIYSSEYADYTRFGGGAEVNVARLVGLNKALSISGSYEYNEEKKGVFNPQTDRIMAGAKIGIWRGLSLLGGFQQLSKKFDNPYEGIVEKTSEVLAIGGPQVKISEGAEFSLHGGYLSNSIEGGGVKLDLDKYIVSGIVTVKF